MSRFVIDKRDIYLATHFSWIWCNNITVCFRHYTHRLPAEKILKRWIVERITYELVCGIKVGEHMIETVKFANAKALVASSKKDNKSWWIILTEWLKNMHWKSCEENESDVHIETRGSEG